MDLEQFGLSVDTASQLRSLLEQSSNDDALEAFKGCLRARRKFAADSAVKLGRAAHRHFEEFFPDPLTLSRVLELPGHGGLPRHDEPRG